MNLKLLLEEESKLEADIASLNRKRKRLELLKMLIATYRPASAKAITETPEIAPKESLKERILLITKDSAPLTAAQIRNALIAKNLLDSGKPNMISIIYNSCMRMIAAKLMRLVVLRDTAHFEQL